MIVQEKMIRSIILEIICRILFALIFFGVMFIIYKMGEGVLWMVRFSH